MTDSQTPMTDKLESIGGGVSSLAGYEQLARRLERNNADLIAALAALESCPMLSQDSVAYRGCKHSQDAVTSARATLARVQEPPPRSDLPDTRGPFKQAMWPLDEWVGKRVVLHDPKWSGSVQGTLGRYVGSNVGERDRYFVAGVSFRLYEIDSSDYYVENVRGRWDAYLPQANDMRLHLWESLAHRTRASALAAVRIERRRVSTDLKRALIELLA